MSDTEQTKAKKEPTVLQAFGVGLLIGLTVSAFVYWESHRTPMENIQDIINSFHGFLGILFVCITGSLFGRAKFKNFIGVWLGPIISVIIWGLLAMLGIALIYVLGLAAT